MKLTKKILSLVLAVSLVLGSIAVAANAADYDGLTYEGSELTYKITADKTEVKPGETVTFSVYMKNNYYIGASGGEFFLWTKGVFNDITEDDVVSSGIVAKTYNVTPNLAPASGVYPSTHAYADWSGYLSSRNANAGTVPEIISDFQLIYTITLTVKEDATPGTTATFEMPAGSLKSAAQTGRKGTIYQAMASSTSNAATSIAYSETVDLSEASVTVTVASAVEYCDYTALETAVAKAPELAEEYYDEAEYKAWSDAKAAGQALLDAEALEKTDENQKTIDDAAELVESTLAALDARYLSLDKLNSAVEACDTVDPADADYYNADDYAAWQAALAEAKAAQTTYTTEDPATKQAEVDAIADALTAAYAVLEAKYLDITPVKDAIDACDTPEYGEEYYDPDLFEAWVDTLQVAGDFTVMFEDAADTEENRNRVAELAQKVYDAYAALVPNFVDLTDLINAIAECKEPEYTEEYYDADEYAAYTAALEAANAGLTDYAEAADTAENQTAVAELASDLRAAFAELDARFVDTTPISVALEECVPEYDAEYYDAEALKFFQDTVAAAQLGIQYFSNAADTEDNRNSVAEVAQTLYDAYKALVPQFVSYEKLEAALVDYSTTEHPEFYYTADSWADYADALAAANEANVNRPSPLPAATEANQAEVDKFADDLEAAYNALTAADCTIISVTPLQETYDVGDTINFAVLVQGTASKIQIIKASGVTSTYAKTHSAVKSITDNEDGTETWIIARRIFEEEYTEYAKAKVGRIWDEGVVPFDVKCTGEDSEVKSIEVTLDGEVVTSVLRSDVPTLTIVTGPAARRIRLVDPVTGGSLTYNTPAVVNDDGTKVWVIVKQYYEIKDYDLDVYVAGSDNRLVDSGLDFELTVTEEAESQLPSTGKVEDAILSAEVAKARLVRGATQTFTLTTDKAAKAVRLINEDGKVVATIKTAASADDTTATWTYECTYSSMGDRSYTAEALYGSTWLADADAALSFTVVY